MRSGYREQWPEAGRFWIRFEHRSWPGAPEPWAHLGRSVLGREKGPGGGVPSPAISTPLPDAVYLPPVAPELDEERLRCAGDHLAAGTPVLWQVQPGQAAGPEGAFSVLDLSPALLEGQVSPEVFPDGVDAAVWPLIPGISDGEEMWEEWLPSLQEAGIPIVVPQILELTPGDKRKFSERLDEEAYGRLFHGSQPRERELCQRIHRQGLQPFPPRPLPPGGPMSGAWRRGRDLAEKLLLAGELWDRLGKPPGVAHGLLSAGRWVDGTNYDLPGLAREGNLKHLPVFSGASLDLASAELAGESSRLLDELLLEYLEGGGEECE